MLAILGPDLVAYYCGALTTFCFALITVYVHFRQSAREQLVKDHEAQRDDAVVKLGALSNELQEAKVRLDKRQSELDLTITRLNSCEERCRELGNQLVELIRLFKESDNKT